MKDLGEIETLFCPLVWLHPL